MGGINKKSHIFFGILHKVSLSLLTDGIDIIGEQISASERDHLAAQADLVAAELARKDQIVQDLKKRVKSWLVLFQTCIRGQSWPISEGALQNENKSNYVGNFSLKICTINNLLYILSVDEKKSQASHR